MKLPPTIRTDASNPFAHHTLKVRVPAVIRDVILKNRDYPRPILDALARHADQVEADALIPPLDLPAPDYSVWQQQWVVHRGETWLNAEWLYAEVYNYRLIMQDVRWFELGRDPYAPNKHEELASTTLWATLEKALDAQRLPIEERLSRFFHYALWGNRIDLSYAISRAHGNEVGEDDLIVDDSASVVTHLLQKRETGRGSTAHFIMDNAGTELALDLALADILLRGVVDQVVLHVKQHPTFVSDTIPADVLIFLSRLERRDGEFRRLGERLQTALDAGRLRVMPDSYWNSSLPFHELPPHLVQTFQRASLVISKGDLNYRRLLSDALWNPATSFAEVVHYFKPPIVALRTLKSDTLVGLPIGRAEILNMVDTQWRVNGKRGLIQAAHLHTR